MVAGGWLLLEIAVGRDSNLSYGKRLRSRKHIRISRVETLFLPASTYFKLLLLLFKCHKF